MVPPLATLGGSAEIAATTGPLFAAVETSTSPRAMAPKRSVTSTEMRALWLGVLGATTVALASLEVSCQPMGAVHAYVRVPPSGSMAEAVTVKVPPRATVAGLAVREERIGARLASVVTP